jgi:DNA primase
VEKLKVAFKEKYNLAQRWMNANRRYDYEYEKITDEELMYICDKVDMQSVLLRLGVYTESVNENELRGYCPDHELRTGRKPSDPKWFISKKTGKCFCHTECRGSNIVYLVKNLLKYKTIEEAKKFILNGNDIPSVFELRKSTSLLKDFNEKNKKTNQQKHEEQIKEAKQIIEQHNINQNCLDFFENDGIKKETLVDFNVSCADNGRYSDRAIVPFIGNNKEIVGFVAIDTLKKKKWVRKKVKTYIARYGCNSYSDLRSIVKKANNSYKKVVFCSGSNMGEHVFGLNEYIIPKNMSLNEIVIVEGERDAIKLLQEGISTLSNHGAKLTEEQKRIIVSINPKEVYLAFDADSAGEKATKKALEMLNGKVNAVIPMQLPTGKDPKKFNGEDFKLLMKQSKEIYYNVNNNSPFEKNRRLK